MDQCILPTMTYGCQTWSLNKQMTNKLRTAQRAMERKMLDLKLKDTMLGNQKENKDYRYHRIHTETKMEMSRSYSKIKGQ